MRSRLAGEVEDLLHGRPFLSLDCPWQWLLKSRHQRFPLCYFGIGRVGDCFGCSIKPVIGLHDHGEAIARSPNLHADDASAADTFGNFRPDAGMMTTVLRDERGVVPEIEREAVSLIHMVRVSCR